MLGSIEEMKKSGKWGCILDCNGNVGTFMKYKASYWAGWELTKDGTKPDES